MKSVKHSEMYNTYMKRRKVYDERFGRMRRAFEHSLKKLEKIIEQIQNKIDIMASYLDQPSHQQTE